MQFYRHHFPAAALFVGSFLVGFHADASRISIVSQAPASHLTVTISRPVASSVPIPVYEIDRHIALAATQHGVSPELIRAVIQTESRFDPLAISASGACGLMQLMPATVRRFGVVDCHDVQQNIHAGTRLLKALLIRYDGDISLSMAAYNAGEGAVARHGGIPPYRQTQAYVRNVARLLAAETALTTTGS